MSGRCGRGEWTARKESQIAWFNQWRMNSFFLCDDVIFSESFEERESEELDFFFGIYMLYSVSTVGVG